MISLTVIPAGASIDLESPRSTESPLTTVQLVPNDISNHKSSSFLRADDCPHGGYYLQGHYPTIRQSHYNLCVIKQFKYNSSLLRVITVFCETVFIERFLNMIINY